MAVPFTPNTTCDIYRAGSTPPATPDVPAVPCFLQPNWRGGQEAGDYSNKFMIWTHVLLVETKMDVRDSYVGQAGAVAQDTLYVPDQTGTGFNVVFVERIQRGTPYDHKRVYLDRMTPNWPTNEL
jgi:hypothetical protein